MLLTVFRAFSVFHPDSWIGDEIRYSHHERIIPPGDRSLLASSVFHLQFSLDRKQDGSQHPVRVADVARQSLLDAG